MPLLCSFPGYTKQGQFDLYWSIENKMPVREHKLFVFLEVVIGKQFSAQCVNKG
jgi:hypothetical protein